MSDWREWRWLLVVAGCGMPAPRRPAVFKQQNTFTGRFTPGMMESVFERAKQHAGLG
jgi:hypothetical protein